MLHSYLRALDERVNLKHMYRSYHKTAETTIVLLALLTFLDDIARLCTHFDVHTEMIADTYAFRKLSSQAKHLAGRFLLCGVIALQVAGVAAILSGARAGCKMLMCWCALHPIVYSQITNYEFVSECLSHIGGLLILLAHFHYRCLAPPAPGSRAKGPRASEEDDEEMAPSDRLQHAARLQLFGRILLPSLATCAAPSLPSSRADSACGAGPHGPRATSRPTRSAPTQSDPRS